LARSLSTRVDTLERRLRLADGLDIRIVGVVADTSSVRLGEPDGPVLYQPISAAGRWSRAPSLTRLSVLLPFTGDPVALAQAVHAEVQALDPEVVVTPETIAATMTREADQYLTVVTLTGVLAGLALCLSLVGIYGVTAVVVTQRTREIGIRTALGARPHQIVGLFIWSLRAPLAIGLAAGALLAALAGWWLQWARLLPAGEAANGPWAYAAALALLAGTAGVATLMPSLAAARADPWHALTRE
jgi:ABC-type antimicrobial peptide transport system permease subunit